MSAGYVVNWNIVFTLISHMRNIYLLLHTLKHPYSSIYSFWQVLYIFHHYIMCRVKPWLIILVVRQHPINVQLKIHPKRDTEPKF